MDYSSDLTPQQVEQRLKMPGWVTILQDWKTIAWPAFIALVAALFYFMGFTVTNGRRAALGVSAMIERPPISQEYFIRGAGVFLVMALYTAVILTFAATIRAIFLRLFRHLPDKVLTWVGVIARRRTWGWMVVAMAVITSFLGDGLSGALMKDADGLVLKSAKDIGTSWVRIGIEADQTSIYGYMFLLVGILIFLVALSWWILTRFTKSTFGKMIYGAWVMSNLLLLIAAFGSLAGVSTTFEPYPIVIFSNMQQYLGKDTVAVFLDSDDKQYAFLVVLHVGEENQRPNPDKVILCLPRTEIKWMIVLRQMPLHLIDHYHDFKALLQTIPSNPMPSPNTSGTENPKP